MISSQATDLVTQLSRRGLMIATAESLTAGLLSSAIADVPGASAALSGGVVAYNNSIKHRVLGVSADTLASRGAVDAQTAKQMAAGVRKLFRADIGIATTGVAGPDPSEGKAVGIVFIALATSEATQAKLLRFDGTRPQIRSATVAAALQLVAEWMQRSEEPTT